MMQQRHPLAYDRDAFTRPEVRRKLNVMKSLVDTLLDSDTFVDVIHEAAQCDQSMLKKWSYDGFTYRKGRRCDEGNYLYSLLFHWLFQQSSDHYSGVSNPMHALYHCHPTLMPFDDYNEFNLWSFQGDIIECLLARSSETGSAIPDDVKKDRLSCSRAIRLFSDEWDLIMRWLNRCYVPCQHRPPTQNIVSHAIFILGSK